MMKHTKAHQYIAILDFGSQYTHLISRRLRDAQVFSKIYPHDVPAKKLKAEPTIGIILSGGPRSVYDTDAPVYDPAIFELGVPILGICYGHQLIARHFKGEVKRGEVREYGFAKLKIQPRKLSGQNEKFKIADYLFKTIPDNLQVWMSHGDTVIQLPSGFAVIGKTKNCPISAMANFEKNIYGLQFHPEVHHTKDDNKILWNFAFRICKAKGDWKMRDYLADILQEIRAQARTKKVFMLVSGGVDSTVAFALLQKALGKKQVLGIHIDSGLMRKNESKEIVNALNRAGLTNIALVTGEKYFLKRLKNIADPEKKRAIIGDAYIDTAEEWLKTHYKTLFYSREWLLGQGTIYPDTIESGGTARADKIKTHHNRVHKILHMIKKGMVIEPLSNLYKDEVREIGRKLGIPRELLFRHPFPGPGLAVMTLCSQARVIIPKLNLPPEIAILPIKSTGVQGDRRTYAYPLAVQKNWSFNRLAKFATSITNSHKEINRVAQVVWKRQDTGIFYHSPNLFITKNRLNLLRDIHEIVNEIIKNAGIYDEIWEFPIILLPVGIKKGGQSVVLRPYYSKDTMTANAFHLPVPVLRHIVSAIADFDEIEAIFYDVTNKPPATMQWE